MFKQERDLLDAAQDNLKKARENVRDQKSDEGVLKAMTAVGEVAQVLDQTLDVIEILVKAYSGDEVAVQALQRIIDES